MIDESLKRQFHGAAGYLNTASIGLPPQVAVDAMLDAITEWQTGQAQAAQYDNDVAAARSAFARLVSTPVEQVAIGSQVSALVSLAITAVSPLEADQTWFEVVLIPHTLEVTILARWSTGDRVNIESDIFAKYVERLMGTQA